MDEMTDSRSKIFVSYTSRDSLVTLQLLSQLADTLSPLGTVFIDCLHNTSENPQRKVMEELKSSSAMVVVVSPALMESPWVRLEIECAASKKIPILGYCYPSELGQNTHQIKVDKELYENVPEYKAATFTLRLKCRAARSRLHQ